MPRFDLTRRQAEHVKAALSAYSREQSSRGGGRDFDWEEIHQETVDIFCPTCWICKQPVEIDYPAGGLCEDCDRNAQARRYALEGPGD